MVNCFKESTCWLVPVLQGMMLDLVAQVQQLHLQKLNENLVLKVVQHSVSVTQQLLLQLE
jgi:hypothetical protein